jgi:hypothetical protein
MGGIYMILKVVHPDEDDGTLTENFKMAVKLELKKKKILGLPIAKYGAKRKKAYLEYADGRKEYAE